MIDNFKQIEKLLVFPENYDFYDLQVIRRGKDHPNLPSANRTIKSYYVDSLAYFLNIQDEVKKLCEIFGARAYIYPSRKNYKKVVLSTIMEYARRAKEGDFKRPHKIFASCVGKEKSVEPIWVVDFDEKDVNKCGNVVDFIESECKPYKEIVDIIETKNGYHILTHPFDKMTFRNNFPDIEIKDNNPTILYIPDNL